MAGESLNEGYFCKIPIIKQDTNYISQTSNHHHCNQHAKILMQGFSSHFETKDDLLKTEDVHLKTKDGPSVNRKLLTHILTYIPAHPHTDIWLGRLQ